MSDRFEPFEPCKEWDDKHPATMLRCTDCGLERHCTEDEMGVTELVAPCDKRPDCHGWLDWRWMAVGWCRNCGKIGPHDGRELRGSCSRACLLQWEYAESLGRGDTQQDQMTVPRDRGRLGLAEVVPISAATGRKRRRTHSPGPTAA